jgi:hypothetical protein
MVLAIHSLGQFTRFVRGFAAFSNTLTFLGAFDPALAANPRVIASQAEASAWIRFHILKRRADCVELRKLEAGDIVETTALREWSSDVGSMFHRACGHHCRVDPATR